MSLKVNEIFKSIQGESWFAGLPCVFIRLTGCNLRCTYCDTAYAYEEGNELPVEEILERVASYNCPMVEITGGEPLLQEETPRLATALLQKARAVLVETNGTLDIDVLPKGIVRIMDVKCPDSGESGKMLWGNMDRLVKTDEVKFVLQSRRDYEWAKAIVADYQLLRRCMVLFSPAFGVLEPRVLAGWILEDNLSVRLNLQLHKYIWRPEERGV
ncbi:MAG: radical SAM protein [bacterium]|nr:radical SAM protein [bacterium]